MQLAPVTEKLIGQAVSIMGRADIEEEEYEAEIRALVYDDLTARRLIDVTIEAFGIILISVMPYKISLPSAFAVQDQKGEWQTFPFDAEPVFATAFPLANGCRQEPEYAAIFQNIAIRSACFAAVANAMNAGADLNGATIPPPTLFGIPAGLYSS